MRVAWFGLSKGASPVHFINPLLEQWQRMLGVGDNLHRQPTPCVDEHFISSSSIYLSSFYPCTLSISTQLLQM